MKMRSCSSREIWVRANSAGRGTAYTRIFLLLGCLLTSIIPGSREDELQNYSLTVYIKSSKHFDNALASAYPPQAVRHDTARIQQLPIWPTSNALPRASRLHKNGSAFELVGKSVCRHRSIRSASVKRQRSR